MNVADLAKELNLSNDIILTKLKALKLKAKGGEQELNAVVVSLLKNELKKEIADQKARMAAPAKVLPKWSTMELPPAKGKKKTKEAPAEKETVAKETAAKETAAKEVKKAKTVKEPKAVKSATKAEPAPELPKTPAKKIKALEPEPVKKEPETIKKEPETSGVKAPIKPAEKIEVKDVKSKPKLSTQPFVTLKPLPQKRRKKIDGHPGVPGEADEARHRSEDAAHAGPSAATVASIDVSLPLKERTDLKPLEVKLPTTVKDLAVKFQEKASVVLKKLMQMGVLAHINQNLEEDVVRRLAAEFGFNITEVKTQEEQIIQSHKAQEEDPSLLKARPPVVTFMGHVDHGKTSLLDRIRKSSVADSEHGGITQHIGAYSVSLPKGRITFLDTPGHEAFTAMRARGAHITDLVVLVVAADEGIMPQTEEALDHARAANVPIIVALNKIDKRDANIDRVKKQLADIDLNPEDWGGKTIVVGVSATTGEGIDTLLEMILLEAELLELKANYSKKASGIVVEAQLNRGRGVIADVIVQSGTLKEGDYIVVGPYYGKAKAMFDDHERQVKEAGPSTPVQLLGLPDVPEAGDQFYVVEDERQAREITMRRQEQFKNEKLSARQKMTLEDLYAQVQEGAIKELSVIIKADVQGSVEALKDSLQKIPSQEVKLRFIHTGVGDVNLSDVLLAVASKAVILGFHVGIESRARSELEKNPVDIRQYRIIYDAVNDVRKALEGLLEPRTRKKFTGRVEVRQVFKLTKGIIAGSYVLKGRVHRKDKLDILRNGSVVFSGAISSLKRFKDDVRDVNEGMECGIIIQGYTDVEVGDIFEIYELEEITRKLE